SSRVAYQKLSPYTCRKRIRDWHEDHTGKAGPYLDLRPRPLQLRTVNSVEDVIVSSTPTPARWATASTSHRRHHRRHHRCHHRRHPRPHRPGHPGPRSRRI
ncbi:MAG: hypothetical protein ACLVJH_04150, partial [Faecalibacterium prausnitzii]